MLNDLINLISKYIQTTGELLPLRILKVVRLDYIQLKVEIIQARYIFNHLINKYLFSKPVF